MKKLKTKSERELKKEVQEDIKKNLEIVGKEEKKKKRKVLRKNNLKKKKDNEVSNEDIEKTSVKELLEHIAQRTLEDRIKEIKAMKPKQFYEWVVDIHNNYKKTVGMALNVENIFDEPNLNARRAIILYMSELVNFLDAYEIKFSKAVINHLKKNKCNELLSVLKILNYIE